MKTIDTVIGFLSVIAAIIFIILTAIFVFIVEYWKAIIVFTVFALGVWAAWGIYVNNLPFSY